MAKNRKWQELKSVAEMSKDQWAFFQQRLGVQLQREPMAALVDRLVAGESKPRRNVLMDEIGDIRSRKNRPGRGSMPNVDRRLQALLLLLDIADPPEDIFDGRVYLAVEGDRVKYVGSGNSERIARFSGLSLPTFEPVDGLCLQCLESIALWLCHTGWHLVEATKRSPVLCSGCREQWLIRTLIPVIKDAIGPRWTSLDILAAMEILARRADRQL
jgi:hypothetical protein